MPERSSCDGQSSEIRALHQQLDELKETLRAIQSGEADALFISTPEGRKVYTLSSAEQPYRFLIEKMDQGALMLLPDGRVIFANNRFAKMLGIPLSLINGKRIQEIFGKENVFNALLSETNETCNAVGRTVNILTQKGAPLVAHISLGVLEMDKSRMNYLIITDITKDEETRRLSAIGQTAGMVGHDIRNPLQGIRNDIYLLNSYLEKMPEIETKKEVIESLDGIEKNVEYINKIVADLQDFARAITPTIQEINLPSLCEDVVLTNIPKNIQACCKVDDDAKFLITDPTLLKRILSNLISNAIQAMPKGGTMSIRAYKEAGEVAINVEDSGVGIPEDVKDKIFTPMFTTKSKGQGFGLAVVKRITESLGGTVTFESQEGKGTTFTVRFPFKS